MPSEGWLFLFIWGLLTQILHFYTPTYAKRFWPNFVIGLITAVLVWAALRCVWPLLWEFLRQ